MSDSTLVAVVHEIPDLYGISGAAVGVWVNGEKVVESRDATSLDNRLAVVASSVSDQLLCAQCHLGEGAPVLADDILGRMQEPTAALRGSNLGEAIGWFLREVDGVTVVGVDLGGPLFTRTI